MTILDTWKDSLRIFWPQNFKLFLLVTANAIIKTYKTIFTQLWWLLSCYGLLYGLFVVFVESDYTAIPSDTTLTFVALVYLVLVVRLCCVFGIVLATRSSIAKKILLIFFRIGSMRFILLWYLLS